MSFNASSSVADADGFTSSGSSFALPSSSHGPNRSSHKLVILNGMDEVEVWSDAVVLLFIQYRLLGDLNIGLENGPEFAASLFMQSLLLLKRRVTGRAFFACVSEYALRELQE